MSEGQNLERVQNVLASKPKDKRIGEDFKPYGES